jgi:DNA methylase
MPLQRSLFSRDAPHAGSGSSQELLETLRQFRWHDRSTLVQHLGDVPVFVNEFWTSKQRAAHSLHEVSYRACFKPQLPAFFVDLVTRSGDVVYDPFAGRGTTLIEAALRGRTAIGCDVNPLSSRLILPRLAPPRLTDIQQRLAALDLSWDGDVPTDLLTFYHPATLSDICALRAYLLRREETQQLDGVDSWIRLVAVNRLTGHSPGFFSVYTLPPNQAASITAQQKINRDRQQTPSWRDIKAIILKKSASLLKDVDETTRLDLERTASRRRFRTGSCDAADWPANSVRLIVTSPPFLDVVDYAGDNWLRCWFCGLSARAVPLAVFRRVEDWAAFMTRAFAQFYDVVEPGGWVAFEVGEVRNGSVRLEEHVIAAAARASFETVCVMVNRQTFTKTANIWGVANNAKGTNTNRIVMLRKPVRP